MRDARVEEVSHVSDSDDEDHDHNKITKSEYTIGIFPNHQGPTYLLMDSKQEMVINILIYLLFRKIIALFSIIFSFSSIELRSFLKGYV